MVIPWYNIEDVGDELVDIQAKIKSSDHSLAFEYEFPMGIPKGTFEKLSCVLQDIVTSRVDWGNALYGEYSYSKAKL
jgi:hypothetical protein